MVSDSVVALVDNAPVENLPEVLNRVLTHIAVVEIVGMLPHIDGNKRYKIVSKWSAGIGL